MTPISQAYAWPSARPKTASVSSIKCLLQVSGQGTTGIGSKRVAFDFASLIATGSAGSPVELGVVRVKIEGTGATYEGVVTETTRASNALILKGTLKEPAGVPFNAVLLTRSTDSVPYGFVFAFKEGDRDLGYGSVKPLDTGEIRIGLCEDAL